MKNALNENVFILTATFSCSIVVTMEEISIKKPTAEQLQIEKIIIQSELTAYRETLATYKNISAFSNFISDTPGFEETFQQKRDYYIAQYGIHRISNENFSNISMVNPDTFGLAIDSPTIYLTPHYTIINARGLEVEKDSSSNAENKNETHYTSISGLSINESTISFNMGTTCHRWRKTSMEH
ncbi:hypothetical protein I6G82_21440 [Lysinibacillus macroides]|uniref:Uncharacterized protein n=1 Tax=Lysinibacillus macroides TaxID=33935 RepID=A0A0N0CUU4_9BACI|nr:hypothetical protein [Lysinibacillus macroides]KOY80414.1 hypothetical protein ADM90_21515 [Lysinibacillus macroides]QPR67726.1 hypothetical protein I6G82_21440 [Lysinibacillus macroides]